MSTSPRGRLLIVDDEAELLKVLGETAAAHGYDVTSRGSGAEALALLRETSFDLLLSDLMMPGMDGITLLRSALAIDHNLVAIIMTGQGTVSTAVEAMKLGAFDYVLKPFKMSALVPTLERGLAVRRLRLENLQLRESLAIYELSQAITLALDPSTVLTKVADAAIRQTQADEASILLLTEDGTELSAAYLRGDRLGLHVGDRVPIDRGIVGWVAQHKEPLLLQGEVNDPRFAPRKPRPEIASAICQPMLVGNRLVGILSVNVTQSRRSFTLGQIKALSILTSLGATALEVARLYDKAHQEALLLNLASDAILVSGPTRLIRYWNRSAERLYGWAAAEAIGQDARLLLLQQPLSAQVRADLALAEDTLAKQGEWSGEVRHVTRAGKEIIVFSRKTLVRDASGQLKARLIINTDVTAKKELENQLLHSQRMESIGTLAGGVAHDFNNLLTIINGYSEIIRTELPAGNRVREMAGEIGEAGQRAAGLTRQLLAFSRKQVLEPRSLSLNAVVADTERMLRRLIGEDVAMTTALDPNLGHVKADPGQLEQVIMNLAVNARDAMPQGGQLFLKTGNVQLDESYTRAHPDLRPGPYSLLAVSDTGTGMDEATLARIFEPFFTTKGQGKGTGLGLATVYGIVKQSGGHVAVDSEPGRGTTFKVYLPRIAEEAPPARAIGTQPDAMAATETILFAEDEAALRVLAKHVLRFQGYAVLDAGDGAEALRTAREHPGPIHLLITDVVMPGMSGRKLAEQVVALRPEVKVLYLSGYTDDAVVRHGILQAEFAYLQKPFTPALLASKVREVLDSAAVR